MVTLRLVGGCAGLFANDHTQPTVIAKTHPVSWEEYARAVHLVLNGLGKGINVDFKSRNLVGVGHSMGASALSVSH